MDENLPLLNKIIEQLSEVRLRALVYQYTYSVPDGPAEVVKAYADQLKFG